MSVAGRLEWRVGAVRSRRAQPQRMIKRSGIVTSTNPIRRMMTLVKFLAGGRCETAEDAPDRDWAPRSGAAFDGVDP